MLRRYRNRVTGAIIEIKSIGAGDWELIDAPISLPVEDEKPKEKKPVTPKKKTKKKEG